MELYLFSLSMPSWHEQGRLYFFYPFVSTQCKQLEREMLSPLARMFRMRYRSWEQAGQVSAWVPEDGDPFRMFIQTHFYVSTVCTASSGVRVYRVFTSALGPEISEIGRVHDLPVLWIVVFMTAEKLI